MRRATFRIPLELVLATCLCLAAAGCSASASTCPQCGRPECRNLSFTVQLRGGDEVRTCCPRCGLHYLAHEHPEVAALRVRDFLTARSLDASRAIFVEGSDVAPCCRAEGPPPRDPTGAGLKPVYDRCLPSLLAFASRADAEAFAREHGGRLKTFADLEREIS